MASCLGNAASGLAALAAALTLSACGAIGGDVDRVWALARASFGAESPGVQRDMVERVPYASIGVRFGGSPQAFVVLARKEGDRETYISADRAVLAVANGRLVQTAGYAFNLDRVQAVDDARLTPVAAPRTVRFLYDLRDLGQFGMPVTCTHSAPKAQDVETLGLRLAADRIDESCEAPSIDWSFENSFWVSRETGAVLLSRQTFHPRQPPLEIQVLRPAAG